MKLLKSKRFDLPAVYFITDREKVREIPPGVPFIYGDSEAEKHLIRILEYEILFEKAKKSGYPFNFKKILLHEGFIDIIDFEYDHPLYFEFTSEGLDRETEDGESTEFSDLGSFDENKKMFQQYIKDSAVHVDIEKLKSLNVFPLWLDTLEKAVYTNIHNFAAFNNNMYNKKLEGMYGGIDLIAPSKNLIVIDISGSIPKGVSATCLALAKNLTETFYSDLLITGSKSTLYTYENLHTLNIETIYEENGMDNDQIVFKKLVTDDIRAYKTAIVFGDNHTPCQTWSNEYNKNTKFISREEGKKFCKWTVEKVISFHTTCKPGQKNLAGYADWFSPKETEYIDNWVNYLND
jgi:hypothetical protein